MQKNAQGADKAKRPWLAPLFAALLLGFTVCVFAPVEAYFSAGEELWFTAWDFIPLCIAAFIVLSLALFALSLPMKGKVRSAYCGLLFGLALAFFVQGIYANADYGLLDGAPIDWSSFGAYPVWNAIMWALLLLVPTALCAASGGKSAGATRFACVMLAFVQLLSGATLAATAKPKQNLSAVTFTDEKLFNISSDKNVVMFVIDTFDTTSLGNLLEQRPDIADRLDGFTWFRNFVGQYNMTSYAMPVLLTGESFILDGYQGAFRTKAWERERFFKALKSEGYSIGLYTERKYTEEAMQGTIDNVLKQGIKPSSVWSLWLEMMKLTAFRYMPHALKPTFADAGQGFGALQQGAEQTIYDFSNETTLSKFRRQGLSADIAAPCFRMYHLYGMHRPYTLGVDEKNGAPVTGMEQAATLMNAVCDYMDIMKELGVYDSSMIIITADHGLKYYDLSPATLIKRPGDKGGLKANAAPAAQADLHTTIAAAMGVKAELKYGKDMFTLSEDDMREAPYYDTAPVDGNLYEYAVYIDEQGQLLYSPTDVVYAYMDVRDTEKSAYELSSRIDIKAADDLLPWLDELSRGVVSNLSGSGGVYLGKPDTTFDMLIEDEDYGDLRVTLGLSGLIGDKQRASVLCDGELVAEVELKRGDSALSFVIPYDYCDDYELTFTLRFPDAVSEYEQSGFTGGDMRRRAICVDSFIVERIEEE